MPSRRQAHIIQSLDFCPYIYACIYILTLTAADAEPFSWFGNLDAVQLRTMLLTTSPDQVLVPVVGVPAPAVAADAAVDAPEEEEPPLWDDNDDLDRVSVAALWDLRGSDDENDDVEGA